MDEHLLDIPAMLKRIAEIDLVGAPDEMSGRSDPGHILIINEIPIWKPHTIVIL
jgi:hypothetical protein